MGGTDFSGIGQGLGDVGTSLVAHRERREVKREREEDKAERIRDKDEIKREREAAKRLQVAKAQMDAVAHLPAQDQNRQRAAAEYEVAMQGIHPSFRLPRKKMGAPAMPAAPASTSTLPAGKGPFADVPGHEAPVRPATAGTEQEIIDVGGVEEDSIAAIRDADQWRAQIDAAPSGASRQAVLASARRWADEVRRKFPNLADKLPDYDQLARDFDLQDTTDEAARVAKLSRDEWKRVEADARKGYESALGGKNLLSISHAIDKMHSVWSVGKKAGYLESVGSADKVGLLKNWARLQSDPNVIYTQIPEEWWTAAQRELVKLMLGQKRKSAAPAKGRAGRKVKRTEETGF